MAERIAKESNEPMEAPGATAVPAPASVSVPGGQASPQTNIPDSIRRLPVWSWVVLSVVVLFALVGVVAAGLAALHSIQSNRTAVRQGGSDYALKDDQSGSGSSQNGGMPGGRMGGAPGETGRMGGASNSATRVSGVVTAVSGDTITVAGNGTTTTVKVTDSTTYTGAAKPAAVNDTITVFGTTADDVLTATSVRLVRQ